MAFEVNDILINSGVTGTTAVFSDNIVVGSLSATTLIVSAITQNGQPIDVSGKADLSGATFTGVVVAPTLSATTYQNLPTDIRVTGGTFNNNTDTITFTNNTGGTFNVTGITDVFVTGGTFNNNILTLTNNSGGTVSTLINNFSGLTINGNLTVTGTSTSANISATTITGTSAVVSSFRIPTSPISGYILTSDANGNATWQASPTPSSGSTRLDLQSVSANTSVTSTNNSSTWVDIGSMTITAKNLGSTATTYTFNFSCTAALSANAGSGNFRILLNLSLIHI